MPPFLFQILMLISEPSEMVPASELTLLVVLDICHLQILPKTLNMFAVLLYHLDISMTVLFLSQASVIDSRQMLCDRHPNLGIK